MIVLGDLKFFIAFDIRKGNHFFALDGINGNRVFGGGGECSAFTTV